MYVMDKRWRCLIVLKKYISCLAVSAIGVLVEQGTILPTSHSEGYWKTPWPLARNSLRWTTHSDLTLLR